MKNIYCYTGSKESSTYWDAYFLQKYAQKFRYSITSSKKLPNDRNDLLLFTDPSAFCAYASAVAKYPHKIVCWWHGDKYTPNKGVKKRIPIAKKYLPSCTVIVSCDQGEKSVLSIGVPKKNIVRIPLGVDLSIFRPEKKSVARSKIGVPDGVFCVGSFQRDTDKRGGPKKIKGPDLFADAITIAKESIPNIFVLLSGRRRDYVMGRLKSIDVPCKHILVDKFERMARLYSALDCYLMSSRVEGGPKSLIESPACNTPVVATDCGMAKQVIKNGVNGFLCDIDASQLAVKLVEVYQKGIAPGGLRPSVQMYDYKNGIINKYESLFLKILEGH